MMRMNPDLFPKSVIHSLSDEQLYTAHDFYQSWCGNSSATTDEDWSLFSDLEAEIDYRAQLADHWDETRGLSYSNGQYS